MQRIIEHKDVAKYIISRNLLNQYRKAKMYLLDNQHDTVKFKLRQPKSKWIYQFRVTQKYRAFGYFVENDIFKIFEISDHQE